MNVFHVLIKDTDFFYGGHILIFNFGGHQNYDIVGVIIT